MTWTLNNIRIYAQGYSDATSAIIARLQPVGTKTVHQYFGYESPRLSLRGLVTSTSGVEVLKSYRTTGISYTLSGPEGLIGDFFVKDVRADLQQTVHVTLFDQPSLDPQTPLYTVALELYEDE